MWCRVVLPQYETDCMVNTVFKTDLFQTSIFISILIYKSPLVLCFSFFSLVIVSFLALCVCLRVCVCVCFTVLCINMFINGFYFFIVYILYK